MHIGTYWTASVGANGVSPVLELAGRPHVSVNGTTSGPAVITLEVSENGTNWVATDKATASGTSHHLYATLGAKFARLKCSAAVTVTIVFGANN